MDAEPDDFLSADPIPEPPPVDAPSTPVDAPAPEPEPEVKRGRGRLSGFTPEIADAICNGLVEGKSLKTICQEDGMPSPATVFRWLAAHEDFRENYARAREAQADTLADELLDIADDGTNDWMEKRNQDGEVVGWTLNGEAVRRSEVRINTRKWIASKLQPKKYADKIEVEQHVTHTFAQLTDTELYAQMIVGSVTLGAAIPPVPAGFEVDMARVVALIPEGPARQALLGTSSPKVIDHE